MIYWWRWFEGQSQAALGTHAQEKDSSESASPPPPAFMVLTERSQSETLTDTRTIEKLFLLLIHGSLALLRTDLRLINLTFFFFSSLFFFLFLKLLFFTLGMWACKLAGSHAMGKGKVSVWDLSTRKLNKLVPSQNKALHRARRCSGAAAEAAARSGAEPAVVNWNVLEARLPRPATLLWRRHPGLIWIPDCFLSAVWSGCVGRNGLVCRDAGCSVRPSAGQARRDAMESWPWALSLAQARQRQDSSLPEVCPAGSPRNTAEAGKGRSGEQLGSPVGPHAPQHPSRAPVDPAWAEQPRNPKHHHQGAAPGTRALLVPQSFKAAEAEQELAWEGQQRWQHSSLPAGLWDASFSSFTQNLRGKV